MAIPKHANEAAARMKMALAKIDEARSQPPTLKALHRWLASLTDYSLAAADIQAFDNESAHEKLHELAGRTQVETIEPARRRATAK